ncbi:hypothetical protein [Tolypothrix sp. NIES-4075]|uniref:hypothetical protein n=1 Tax=Tolypothrix sp. NIES-4075 TaxID=2005459 RepID=UPI001356EE8B|nr:hypothetical protein [Tolypothrix sp. NIES-4075]
MAIYGLVTEIHRSTNRTSLHSLVFSRRPTYVGKLLDYGTKWAIARMLESNTNLI